MLDSLPQVANVLLSNGESWLSDGVRDAPLRAANAIVTPQEPTTLALALVGIGCVAIYLVATGWRLPRRNLTSVTDDTTLPSIRPRTTREAAETPTRGAA
jgi:hypothetical protein